MEELNLAYGVILFGCALIYLSEENKMFAFLYFVASGISFSILFYLIKTRSN